MAPTFTNLFTVRAGPQIVQIEFNYQRAVSESPMPAAAVTLSRVDGEALRDLLTKMLEASA